MITAKILLDSINSAGERITTFLLVYPRFIHSEFMTHRVFSRNAASSRAIPIEKMIKAIEANPAIPVHWGKIQKGMQAEFEVDKKTATKAKAIWLKACKYAIKHSRELAALGVHKQIANRITEPFSHMMTLLTSTEYENFFALRADKEAQPEIQVLAHEMLKLYNESTPQKITEGWHIPFADDVDTEKFESILLSNPKITSTQLKLKIATARCARTSYTTPETLEKHNYERDIEFHDDLERNGHFSPFEHIAYTSDMETVGKQIGNFKGWKQYRKFLSNENRKDIRVIKKEL